MPSDTFFVKIRNLFHIVSKDGQRITMVRNALIPFIEQICNDPNTIIKLVLFNRNVETVDIPKDKAKIRSVIESKVYAAGGTDFHSASQGLVREANNILTQYPTYQVVDQ